MKAIEKIPLKIAFGDLERSDTDIKFVRKSDGQKTSFPLGCSGFLDLFLSGKTIQEVILHLYQRGEKVDFTLLKHTLLTLYWSGNLENKSAFKASIESTDWIPVKEGRLLRPLTEVEQKGSFFQILVFLLSVSLVLFTAKLFVDQDSGMIALLFFPQAFLMSKGIFSEFISALMRKKSSPANMHISALGLYLREASTKHRAISAFEFTAHFVILMTMSLMCLYFFKQTENRSVSIFGSALTLLVTCLLLSPSHKTDVSKLFLTLEKSDMGPSRIWTTTLVLNALVVYIGLIFCFYLVATVEVVAMVSEFGNDLFLARCILLVFSVALFLDLLEDLEFMLEQMKSQLSLPMRALFAKAAKSEKDLKTALSVIPIFKGMSEAILSEMARHAFAVHHRRGGVIFREGDTSSDLYVVVKGSVGIYKKQGSSKLQLMQMGAGSVFGEGGFFLSRPRGGDAVSLTDTSLICIKRPPSLDENYKIPVASAGIFQRKIWAFQALSQSPLFKNIPSELAMQLVGMGEIKEIAAQSNIMKKGDPPDALWILIEGECRAMMGPQQTRDLHSGDVIGEIGIFWNTRRTSQVITTKQSILLRVDARAIWPILSGNLNLCVALQELGAARLSSEAA